jgi:SnoaL-like domain
MEHTAISPEEAADRLAIRELVDVYAHCADRREAEAQKALFTADTHFLVYMNGAGTEPTEDSYVKTSATIVDEWLDRLEEWIDLGSTSARSGWSGERPALQQRPSDLAGSVAQ